MGSTILMNIFRKNIASMYTGIFQYAKDIIVEKTCRLCLALKDSSFFYNGPAVCIECIKKSGRGKYPKSVCKYCSTEFKSGIRGRYGFCSEKCRFMDKVEIGEGNTCWLWKASLKGAGYGSFFVANKHLMAHRESFRIFKGPILKDKCIMHVCDNRICVRPDHLRMGTALDNVRDKISKGRAAPILSGEKHHWSNMTESIVLEIRELHKKGHSQREIGRRFNINWRNVHAIVKRINWKHI